MDEADDLQTKARAWRAMARTVGDTRFADRIENVVTRLQDLNERLRVAVQAAGCGNPAAHGPSPPSRAGRNGTSPGGEDVPSQRGERREGRNDRQDG